MTNTHPASTTEMWEKVERAIQTPTSDRLDAAENALDSLRTRMEELERQIEQTNRAHVEALQERDEAQSMLESAVDVATEARVKVQRMEAVVEAARELGLASKPESWARLDAALSSYDQEEAP